MSIDVEIKQKLFGKKTMPLEVILGERLHYGKYSYDTLTEGELGEHEFVAYGPYKIGRGFSVIWNPSEKKKISLRLTMPSTTFEIAEFYASVERMVKYWEAILIVDGKKVSLEFFMAGFQNTIEFNNRGLKMLAKKVLDENYTMTLHSAMWPLAVGKEEATMFLNDLDSFTEWLHEKQSMDVYYETPRFYIDENGFLGRFFLTNDLSAVFPNTPVVPLGVVDPKTGKLLECNRWVVVLSIDKVENIIGEIEYSEFLSRIPESKKSAYDGRCFLLSELTEEEIMGLLA